MARGKIPTKAELIQLQKLYKTDEKIAERLGGATPQLVAYWRRKKNIPRHSFAKFSAIEIREVWERFGDDYRCGLELGISKAAFYNWRRKYGLKERPAFLKLEQLELNLGGPNRGGGRKSNYGRQTIAQKILAEHGGREQVEVGDSIEIEPDVAILHARAAEVVSYFRKTGSSYVWNPNRIVITLNDTPPVISDGIASEQKSIREFAARQNIKYFYDIRDGACHQVVMERGHVLPGQLALGIDSHATSYGSIGAFASGIDIDAMGSLWSGGKATLKVPDTIKIDVNGKPSKGVYARDISLFVSRNLPPEGSLGRAMEYYGSTISQMSISERFTLTHLASEMGTAAAICPFDTTTRRYFMGRTKMPYRPALADKDAAYESSYEFNISQLVPQAARPGTPLDVVNVGEIEGLHIDQVIIGSCAGGRSEDLRVAADIIKGKKVHSDVRMYIYPGSRAIYLEALKKGLMRAFIEAGAIIMNPGCGSCGYDHSGMIAPGERCLSTGTRGGGAARESSHGEIYLVSPATAAASAIKGAITDPRGYLR